MLVEDTTNGHLIEPLGESGRSYRTDIVTGMRCGFRVAVSGLTMLGFGRGPQPPRNSIAVRVRLLCDGRLIIASSTDYFRQEHRHDCALTLLVIIPN